MTFLLFLILGQFNLEVHAADESKLAKKNPTITFIENGIYDVEYPTVAVENRKESVPKLSDNPSCRIMRDSVIKLCSQKADLKDINAQYYQIDQSVILNAKKELGPLLKEFQKLSEELNEKLKQQHKTKSAYQLKYDTESKKSEKYQTECYSILAEINTLSARMNQYEVKSEDAKRLSEVSKKFTNHCVIPKNKLEALKDKRDEPIKDINYRYDEVRQNIRQLEDTISNAANRGIDIWSFGKESPCESLRLDYDKEGFLAKMTLLKKDTKSSNASPISYEIVNYETYTQRYATDKKIKNEVFDSRSCGMILILNKKRYTNIKGDITFEASLSDVPKSEFNDALVRALGGYNLLNNFNSTDQMRNPPPDDEAGAKK